MTNRPKAFFVLVDWLSSTGGIHQCITLENMGDQQVPAVPSHSPHSLLANSSIFIDSTSKLVAVQLKLRQNAGSINGSAWEDVGGRGNYETKRRVKRKPMCPKVHTM
jgi:hypothetical protein